MILCALLCVGCESTEPSKSAGSDAAGGTEGGSTDAAAGGADGAATVDGGSGDASIDATAAWSCTLDPARTFAGKTGYRESSPQLVRTGSGAALVFRWTEDAPPPVVTSIGHLAIEPASLWSTALGQAWVAEPPNIFGLTVGSGMNGLHAYLFVEGSTSPGPADASLGQSSTKLVQAASVGASPSASTVVSPKGTRPLFVAHTSSGNALFAFAEDHHSAAPPTSQMRLFIGSKSFDDYACATQNVQARAVEVGPTQFFVALTTSRPFETCAGPQGQNASIDRLQLLSIAGDSQPVLVHELQNAFGPRLRGFVGNERGAYLIYTMAGEPVASAIHIQPDGTLGVAFKLPALPERALAVAGEDLLVLHQPAPG